MYHNYVQSFSKTKVSILIMKFKNVIKWTREKCNVEQQEVRFRYGQGLFGDWMKRFPRGVRERFRFRVLNILFCTWQVFSVIVPLLSNALQKQFSCDSLVQPAKGRPGEHSSWLLHTSSAALSALRTAGHGSSIWLDTIK